MNAYYKILIMKNTTDQFKKRIAVIDTGSNTIRLAVFEVKKNGNVTFKELLDKKSVAGLSAYVEDGIFTQPGIARASNSLKYQIKRANNLNCDELFIFATAVLRNCSNRNEAVQKIENNIEHRIEVLSGGDEARLGIKGATYGTDINSGIMIDLGGGSCEVTNFEEDFCEGKSLRIGCVSAFAQYIKGIFPTSTELARIKVDAANQFDAGINFEKIENKNLYCIGGSVRAVSKMVGTMSGEMKWPKIVTFDDLMRIEQLLFSDQDNYAHMAVAANADRVHSLAPGVAILEVLMEKLNKDSLQICKRGLREGYLLSKVVD